MDMSLAVIRVLLVEDSPTDARLLQAVLAEERVDHFALTTVARLRDALTALAQAAFDIVLLDLGLPDSQGLATFERLHAAAPHMPVVVFSGNIDTRAAVEAVKCGAQDYLVKGQTAGDLVPRAIRYAVERHRNQMLLQEMNRVLEQRVTARTREVQDLYDNAPCGYHSLDSAGRYVHVNATELTWLGRSRDDVIGRQFVDFVDSRGRQVFAEYFPILLEQGFVKDLDFDFVRPDGARQPVSLSATAVRDPQGNFVMSRSTSFDMLERRRVAEALQLANLELARALRIKDEFLASMSHELRTPLHTILVSNEVLAERMIGELNERQQKYVDMIDTSGRHLLALINDILDLAKIEAGRLTLDLDECLVEDLCCSSFDFVRELAVRKELHTTLSLAQPHVRMVADPRRLKQMLINLLTNAVKFTPAGGQVSLEVQADLAAGTIEFAVQDSGVGIAPDNMAMLFKPFTQLDSSLARRQEGTGLGLALVSRLVRLHGGSVRAQSAGVPGLGSRFILTLPLRANATEDIAGSVLPEASAEAGTQLTATHETGCVPRSRKGV
jgi:PAS domain S-box-containing protein